MLKKIESKEMGSSHHGWLTSWFHFSFDEYYDPHHTNFGVLRVLNDDLIQPGTGFDMHRHENMEIITYVVDGELTHADSMKNERTLRRGEVQYMSAGTGVVHSEKNLGKAPLRLLQIWIRPDRNYYQPQYGDFHFDLTDRDDKWLHLVSGEEGDAPIQIHQDIHIFAAEISADKSLAYPIASDRMLYVVLIEGSARINGIPLAMRDAVEVKKETDLHINTITDSHVLLFDMKKE